MWRPAAHVLLAPWLVVQARRMRRTVVELPEPAGPRAGEERPAMPRDPAGPAFRLLVAGDSSAAGVGVARQDEALAQPLARALAARLGRAVRWQLVAGSGLTSAGVLHLLMHGHVRPADAAVLVVGVNDITRRVPIAVALRRRGEIVGWLRAHAGVRQVLIPALPELERFPAIPRPLAWYAGHHARLANRRQAAWAARTAGVVHVPLDGVLRIEAMAVDGYHPGAPLYREVAGRLAAELATRVAAA